MKIPDSSERLSTTTQKYLRQTLVFMWNCALRGKFNFYFSGDFHWYWQNFYFWWGAEHQAIILWGLEIFSNFLSLKVVQELVRQFVCTSLLLISKLCFTCSEEKICSIIIKSQNIMNLIADAIKTKENSCSTYHSFNILFVITTYNLLTTC